MHIAGLPRTATHLIALVCVGAAFAVRSVSAQAAVVAPRAAARNAIALIATDSIASAGRLRPMLIGAGIGGFVGAAVGGIAVMAGGGQGCARTCSSHGEA